jgi:hypothetical protein
MGYLLSVVLFCDIKSWRPHIVKTIAMLILVVASHFVSTITTKIYFIIHNINPGYRYSITTHTVNIIEYIQRVIEIYTHHIKAPFDGLFYFKYEVAVISALLCILAGIACMHIISNQYITERRTKIKILLVCFFLAIITPLILHLPRILGVNRIPIRAFFEIGFMLALAFFLTSKVPGLIRSAGLVTVAGCLLLSAAYINVLYYAAFRQTQADIGRLHEIAARIRSNPQYVSMKEPFGFLIIGSKSMPVIGYKWGQQALNTFWSKYSAFEKFTDLRFHFLDSNTKKEVISKLAGKGYDSYPAYNSILFYKNNVILILNKQRIEK